MGEGLKVALRDAAPCAAMVFVEGCIIGLTILASTALSRGMSPFVFVVYTNALGSIILLPLYFLQRSEEPPVWRTSLPFLIRVFFLGLIGVALAQNLAFVGLSYSSPIVACGMANQIPAFSYIIRICLRTTKFNLKSAGNQARFLGTLLSLMGAISLTLYKGPTIRSHNFLSLKLQPEPPRLLVFLSTHENWVLGCVLYAAASFFLAIWNTIQAGAAKMCPQPMEIIFFYSLFGTIQSALVAVLFERDPHAWRLGLNFELLIIILTAIFSSVIRSSVQIWCTKSKGPYFVSIFKPFGIPYASTFGCLLFPYTFHYGSMMGALVCGMGYYAVLWGQIKEEKMDKNSSAAEKVPLLQPESHSQV